MQYVVKGKVFNDEKEAREYEEKLKTKEEKMAKKEEEKNKRLTELKDIEKEYVNKVNEFYKDYGYVKIDLSGLPNSIDNFFNGFSSFFMH